MGINHHSDVLFNIIDVGITGFPSLPVSPGTPVIPMSP